MKKRKTESKTRDKEGLLPALFAYAVLFGIVVGVFNTVVAQKTWIGPAVFLFGFLPWIPVKLVERSIKSIGADIIYGLVDG